MGTQAAPDIRIGGGPAAASAKSAGQTSELGGSGGMPPRKISFLVMQNTAI